MPEMTPAQAMGRRLAGQHLLDPASDPVAVASRLGSVHAQVASGAALIVGVRTTGLRATVLLDAEVAMTWT